MNEILIRETYASVDWPERSVWCVRDTHFMRYNLHKVTIKFTRLCLRMTIAESESIDDDSMTHIFRTLLDSNLD